MLQNALPKFFYNILRGCATLENEKCISCILLAIVFVNLDPVCFLNQCIIVNLFKKLVLKSKNCEVIFCSVFFRKWRGKIIKYLSIAADFLSDQKFFSENQHQSKYQIHFFFPKPGSECLFN